MVRISLVNDHTFKVPVNSAAGASVAATSVAATSVAAVNGVIASEGTTGATTGTARIDLTAGSTEAGTGTLTVTLKTVSDTSTATLMGNGSAYTTRVASVTSAEVVLNSTFAVFELITDRGISVVDSSMIALK